MSDGVVEESARKVALVTGGTRGLGRGIVRCYHAAGYSTVVCARTAPTEPLRDGEREAAFIEANIRDASEVERVLDFAYERYGRLDVLVNNAGGTPRADLETASPRFHASVIDLNLTAPLNFSVAAWKRMRAQTGGGSILFISSVSAQIPEALSPAYSSAKAGIDSLTIAFAKAFAPQVRVNCITVGLVATPDSADFYGGEAGEQAAHAEIPMGRMGVPDDVGNACVMLSDDERAAWISGANLACHGGRPEPWNLSEGS